LNILGDKTKKIYLKDPKLNGQQGKSNFVAKRSFSHPLANLQIFILIFKKAKVETRIGLRKAFFDFPSTKLNGNFKRFKKLMGL